MFIRPSLGWRTGFKSMSRGARCVSLLGLSMPSRSLRPCGSPGCGVLTHGAFCPDHSRDETERDPRVKRMYNSRRWRSMRERQLANEPWCVDCVARGIHVSACEVDHVIPHRGDASLFFGGKLQSLCKPCHSRKTAREVLVPPS